MINSLVHISTESHLVYAVKYCPPLANAFVRRFMAFYCLVIAFGTAATDQLHAQTNNPPFYWGWRGVNADRGNNWLKIATLPQNPRFIWLVGAMRRVAYSRDSGRTWQSSTVPLTSRRSNDSLLGVSFVDSLVGFASGPAGVFKTVNGGATWTDITPQQTSQVPFGSCHFISRDTGIVVGVALGCSGVQLFYRTTNSGATWAFTTTAGVFAQLNDVRIVSSQGLGYAVGSGYIWRTLDGGVNWNVFNQTNDPNSAPGTTLHRDLEVFGASVLVPFAGTDCRGGGARRGGARFSSDSGKTWREFNAGIPCLGASLLNDSTGWVCGENGLTFYTRDYGKTWTNLNCGLLPNSTINDIKFVNDSTGWVSAFTIGPVSTGLEGSLHQFLPPSQRFFQILVSAQTPTFAPGNNRIGGVRPTEFCSGDEVTLTIPDGYAWNAYNTQWSDGTTFLRAIRVRTSGTYFVAKEVPGCGILRDTVNIIFNAAVSIQADGSTRLCEGERRQLSVRNPQQRFFYEWLNGQTVIGTGASVIVSQAGTYSVRAQRAGSLSTCVVNSSLASVRITVNPRPNTNITVLGKTNLCLGDTAVLQAPTGFVQYSWTQQNRGAILGRSSRFTTTAADNYSVQMVDTNGCTWTSNTVTISTLPYRRQLILEPATTLIRLDTTGLNSITCATFVLRNQDSILSAFVSNIGVRGNIEFSLPQSQFPLTLPPLSAQKLTICFSPQNLSLRNDTMIVDDVCGAVPILLEGVGIFSSFRGISRCSTDVVLRSIGTVLLVGSPAPNPTQDNLSLKIERTTSARSEPLGELEVCSLYNTFGRQVAMGIYTAQRSNNDDKGNSYEQGEFSVDTANLTTGLYMLVLHSPMRTVSFPVVVRH